MSISPLVAIIAYLLVQVGIGVWVSRRIRTETDYILAGRRLGYGLTTFSIFATWFGAETVMGSAGRAYRDGVSLGSAEPFGYGLCLVLMGLVFAGPLWRRGLTTLADLYRQRYSAGAERLAAIILIPGSVLWAAAQVRAFAYVIETSSPTVSADVAIALAAGFTILYASIGGMLTDAITDVIQGVIVVAGILALGVILWTTHGAGASPDVAAAMSDASRVRVMPEGESLLSLVEQWAIPVAGSVIATELVGRVLAARSPAVARRSSYMAAAMYLGVGVVPLLIGLAGPGLAPSVGDPEQLVVQLARDVMPLALYALFAGAVISAILSTVDSTLLTASALLSHNLVVPLLRVESEVVKVRVARWGVIGFGVIAYVLATRAEGVFALVEEASAFGSAGALVTVSFGLFTSWGGARSAIASLVAGMLGYLAGTLAGVTAPFLLSLALAVGGYVALAAWDSLRAADVSPTGAQS